MAIKVFTANTLIKMLTLISYIFFKLTIAVNCLRRTGRTRSEHSEEHSDHVVLHTCLQFVFYASIQVTYWNCVPKFVHIEFDQLNKRFGVRRFLR